MSEQEKNTWKVAIQRDYEDADEYLEEKKRRVADVSREVKQALQDTKDMISTYNNAVDRINIAAASQLGAATLKIQAIEEKNYMKARNLSARGGSRNRAIEAEDIDQQHSSR